jgi:hypothetical protein
MNSWICELMLCVNVRAHEFFGDVQPAVRYASLRAQVEFRFFLHIQITEFKTSGKCKYRIISKPPSSFLREYCQ